MLCVFMPIAWRDRNYQMFYSTSPKFRGGRGRGGESTKNLDLSRDETLLAIATSRTNLIKIFTIVNSLVGH